MFAWMKDVHQLTFHAKFKKEIYSSSQKCTNIQEINNTYKADWYCVISSVWPFQNASSFVILVWMNLFKKYVCHVIRSKRMVFNYSQVTHLNGTWWIVKYLLYFPIVSLIILFIYWLISYWIYSSSMSSKTQHLNEFKQLYFINCWQNSFK